MEWQAKKKINCGKKNHFAKDIFWNQYLVTNCKNCKKLPQLPKIWKWKILSTLSYFEYHQNWLNILRDDHHLNNITNLGEKTL
jgi:hypothetical protein